MKIKSAVKSYKAVMELPKRKDPKPKRRSLLWHTLAKLISIPKLRSVNFKCDRIGMERLSKNEPCFYLMNHSCFLDLQIAISVLYPRPFNIVATTDAFVGKDWLMRKLGCFPTQKFVLNIGTFFDIRYCLNELKSSVLMFPEAGYTFDGRATRLPRGTGALLKRLGVPVVMMTTEGAFLHDPLYNNLQTRKTDVRLKMEYLYSPEELRLLSDEELDAEIDRRFSFDAFRAQEENGVRIDEPFRADCLHRILYKCPHCMTEGRMEGKGTHLTCNACGRLYFMTEYGTLESENGEGAFTRITDWFDWEREEVRRELDEGRYLLDIPVDIALLANTKRLYRIGEGRLRHSKEGFHLVNEDGSLDYRQKPQASYTLNADFYWYELGDVIGIGDRSALYYCFPKDQSVPVAKARLATEELYIRKKENHS